MPSNRSTLPKSTAWVLLDFNIRLIHELELVLDSASYDIALTEKTAVCHIVNGAPVLDYIPQNIIEIGSIELQKGLTGLVKPFALK